MNNIIKDDKLVELSYEITDKKTNESLVKIEYLFLLYPLLLKERMLEF